MFNWKLFFWPESDVICFGFRRVSLPWLFYRFKILPKVILRQRKLTELGPLLLSTVNGWIILQSSEVNAEQEVQQYNVKLIIPVFIGQITQICCVVSQWAIGFTGEGTQESLGLFIKGTLV